MSSVSPSSKTHAPAREPMLAVTPPPSAIAPAAGAIDTQRLRQAASRAVAALKLLGNEDRLLLLCQLSQSECCVGDLESLLGIRQPTLSQQLAVLRAEGVVQTRRDGKKIFYRIADPAILEVLGVLYRLYCPDDETS
jgi:DNA-binding transcriptional ArsR family regulator